MSLLWIYFGNKYLFILDFGIWMMEIHGSQCNSGQHTHMIYIQGTWAGSYGDRLEWFIFIIIDGIL